MNETRETPIARYGNVASTFWDRARGLIGRPALSPDHAFVISPCIAVHALFLTSSIDVLHLDGEGHVLRVLPLFHPWRIGPVVWQSKTVIELPAGTAARTGTVVGDLIAWREPGDDSAFEGILRQRG